jgi:GntR family transcriptional regulator
MPSPDHKSLPAASVGDQVLSIRVDKSNPVPAYVQIAEEIRRLLRGTAAPAGTELPPERLLCEAYGVSRTTLRQALAILEREALIECRQGRGTFLTLGRIEKQQQHLCSFSEEMRARGAVSSTMLLSFRADAPTLPAREFLELPAGDRVYRVERLRLADGTPIALEAVQVPQPLCPNLDRFDLVHDSLYRILEEEYGLTLADGLEEISAIRPNPAQKRLLQVPSSAAVLLVCRRTRTAGSRPVEFAITAYRGDLYTAVIRSARQHPSSDLGDEGPNGSTPINQQVSRGAEPRPGNDGSCAS